MTNNYFFKKVIMQDIRDNAVEEFIEEGNEKNYPYKIVLCNGVIIGDCEQWPPSGMRGDEDKTWCRECL